MPAPIIAPIIAPALDPAALADTLTLIRNHFTAALMHTAKNLPASAAVEELHATRLANRTILELHAQAKIKP